MKKLLIAFAFLIAAVAASAQNKYDYATVNFENYISFQSLVISYSNKPAEIIRLKEKCESKMDISVLLQQSEKLQNDGWELFSDHVTATNLNLVYIYNFRRKK